LPSLFAGVAGFENGDLVRRPGGDDGRFVDENEGFLPGPAAGFRPEADGGFLFGADGPFGESGEVLDGPSFPAADRLL